MADVAERKLGQVAAAEVLDVEPELGILVERPFER
jgi:hypothetical protein